MSRPADGSITLSSAACPRCGSAAARPISTGWVECAGQLTVRTAAHPSGAQGPTHVSAPCRKRYSVAAHADAAAGAGTCSCGLIAIARCYRCPRMLCGDHMHGAGLPLCAGCHRENQKSKAEEDGRSEAASRVKLETDKASIVSMLIELAANDRPLVPFQFTTSCINGGTGS